MTNRQELIERLLSTPESRRKLAQSMATPFAMKMSYQGLWTKIFEGSNQMESFYPRRGLPFHKNPHREFLPNALSCDKAADSVPRIQTEQLNLFTLDVLQNVTTPIKLHSWDDIPQAPSGYRQRGRIIMNAYDFGSLRKEANPDIHPVYAQELVRTGLLAEYRNHEVFVSRQVKKGIIYQFGPPPTVGTCWTNLEILPVEDDLSFAIDSIATCQIELVDDPHITVYAR